MSPKVGREVDATDGGRARTSGRRGIDSTVSGHAQCLNQSSTAIDAAADEPPEDHKAKYPQVQPDPQDLIVRGEVPEWPEALIGELDIKDKGLSKAHAGQRVGLDIEREVHFFNSAVLIGLLVA